MDAATSSFVSPNSIRSAFAAAMSRMYAREVPQYRALVDLVRETNDAVLARDKGLAAALARSGEIARLPGERHGAIRLGTAAELAMIARAFAVMGMLPVGYYDLAPAGVPVHSTAFRAIVDEDLRASPFRIFTSLLRLDLIADAGLRAEAAVILERRAIFTPDALRLIAKAEGEGGLRGDDADAFVTALLETFRWHAQATVSHDTYRRLLASHRLVADVVSFRGPHINHLTPRVLDIDAVQAAMPAHGMAPKETVEGPPPRRCPVLLRQTSFKALEEMIAFPGDSPSGRGGGRGSHTARFGEVEQRGLALTPRGQAIYDDWVASPDGAALDLPDDWAALRRAGLGYFRYGVAPGEAPTLSGTVPLERLIDQGRVTADPIVYEDFLPVSAAGIFQSNLGDTDRAVYRAGADRAAFEQALGRTVEDAGTLYARTERDSLARLSAELGVTLAEATMPQE